MNQPYFLNLEYIFHKIYLFFGGESGGSDAIQSAPSPFWGVINIILYIIILIGLTIIIYCIVRLFEIRKKEHEHLHHEIAEYAQHQKEKAEKLSAGLVEVSKNKQWVAVLQYLLSSNEGDWKLAILEADTMLDQLLDQMGFKGENLGEKLKSAREDNFQNLNLAWEAHTVRNKIAHEGSAFIITSREAKRVVALYEQIFRAYGFI